MRYRLGGLYLEGLIHGGAYFRNFTVFPASMVGIEGQVSTAQKEVAVPTSFSENKVWVEVLSLAGSKTSF